jgi:hypothetical protein
MLIKLELPPGMLQVGTVYQCAGRHYRGNRVRWRNDGRVWAMEPIGGEVQRTITPMDGKVRAAIVWTDDDNLRWQSYGSNEKLYVLTQTSDTPDDITPVGFTAGDADATAGAGYGIGPYGESTYGTPRVDNATYQEASMWTLDTIGPLLYGVMAQDGIVYKWTPPDTGVPAAAVAGAPTGSAIVATDEGFLFVLGAGGDNRKVQWPDQYSDSDWTPGATDQAGDITLQTPGKLLCGRRVRGGTLIFTDMDAWLATYLGPPYVYRFDRIGENCGIISRGAAIAVGPRAYWMGNGRFYEFDGVARELECDVAEGVFGDLNYTQKSKITVHHEPQFSEIWFKYPSGSSTEIDRQVGFNYEGRFWIPHDDFARLAAVSRGVFDNPLMVDSDGIVWDHETGADANGSRVYCETGPYELGNGDNIVRARRLISDEATAGDWQVSFKVRDWPNDTETTYGPYTLSNPTSIRFAARQTRMVIELVTPSQNARWGIPRVDAQEGGRR